MTIGNGMIRSITICAAITIVGQGLYAQEQKPSPTTDQEIKSVLTDADIGRVAFNENCAVCHGMQGTGPDREPYWSYLSKDIPNLADISARNGGVFPFSRVYETIDGRHEAVARGPRDMPIWGRKFKAESVGLNSNYDSEDFTRAKILALTEYVYRLQRAENMQNASTLGSNASCQANGIEFVSEFINPFEETMRAASAGVSSLTGEKPNGESAYLTAYVERPDGSGHPAFSGDEQRILIYKMPSGKYVLRIIQDPPEKYWPGAQ